MNDLDKILDSEELAPYISPAWTEYQSREQMIIRKMRNNVVKKIPKDFGSAIAAEQFNMMDDTYREVHAEIAENANSVVFDADYKEVGEPETPAPKAAEPAQTEPVKETEAEQSQEFEMPDWMKAQ